MSKTINGKPYTTIITELTAPFKEDEFKVLDLKDPQAYLPSEVIKKRFDEVLGPFNYDFSCSDLQLIKTGTQENIILIGTLTIKNDNGEVVTSKSCAGGCSIIYPTNSTTPTKVSNNAESASIDAFKRCAKMLGVGSDQLREMRKNKSNAHDKQYTVKFTSSFSTNTTGGYFANVKVNNEDRVLVIWKDVQAIIEKTVPMSNFIKLYTPGKTLTVYGKLKTYKNTLQLIVSNVVKKDGDKQND